MKNKVLVLYSHPKEESLNYAFKEAVELVIKKNKDELKVCNLYKDGFDPVLKDKEENIKDKVIIKYQENIAWAERIIIITPLWWSNINAMLKGFFDRVFTEGFSFIYNQAGMPEGLFENKRAVLIGTLDTPKPIAHLAGTTMGFKSVINGILKFSGIKQSKYKLFGPVLTSTDKVRKNWIEKVKKLASDFLKKDGILTRAKNKFSTIITAMRLHLSSLAIVSVILGSSIGFSITKSFSWLGFILAATLTMLGHITTSFSNEVADVEADKINKNRTMFNGGTGLILKNKISKQALAAGSIVTTLSAIALAGVLVFIYDYHWLILLCTSVCLIFGIGYSMPPFKFSHRGLGEIAALIAYGIPLVIGGLILQVDKAIVNSVLANYKFYLLAVPISISVFIVLCLTQIPDTEADKTIGKKSISVLIGPAKVLILTFGMQIICIIGFFTFVFLNMLSMEYAVYASIFPLISAIIILSNRKAYEKPAGLMMLNIMGLSVTTAVLCAVVPSVYFFMGNMAII